jgi:hypothetical protein
VFHSALVEHEILDPLELLVRGEVDRDLAFAAGAFFEIDLRAERVPQFLLERVDLLGAALRLAGGAVAADDRQRFRVFGRNERPTPRARRPAR